MKSIRQISTQNFTKHDGEESKTKEKEKKELENLKDSLSYCRNLTLKRRYWNLKISVMTGISLLQESLRLFKSVAKERFESHCEIMQGCKDHDDSFPVVL